MRVGYGYNRHPDDLKALGCERVWIDVARSKRAERGGMFAAGGLRDGDTLVLLDARDLAMPNARHELAELGVTLEIAKPSGSGKRIGAPRKFLPNDDQDAQIKALWLNPGFTLSYVIERAEQIMGRPVARHHLIYRYGNRHERPEGER